jgi:serine/threonine-protein kinase HipA
VATSSSSKSLSLWINGERLGAWRVLPSGDELTYDDHWVASEYGRPLSLSLPFRAGNPPHRGVKVRHYFENLLPDSQKIRERIAKKFHAKSTSAYDLLSEIGRDCVGALQILPNDEAPINWQRIQAHLMDENAVARALRTSLSSNAFNIGDEYDEFRISIAGAQEKIALLWHREQWWQPRGSTPSTHILKLPLGLVGNMAVDLSDSVENEWLCLQILESFGLPVAKCHPLYFNEQKVLAIERFDRRWVSNDSGVKRAHLIRIPQEDFCQATGTSNHQKYEAEGGPGMSQIFEILNGSNQSIRDREIFFRSQLLFWMLCAPDGHAKNFSIALLAGGNYTLTPIYDVMSAYPVLGKGAKQLSPYKVKMAMAVRSKNAHWRMNEILGRHWLELGRRQGIVGQNGTNSKQIIEEIAQLTPKVIERVSSKLPRGFPSRIAEPIFNGLAQAAKSL